MFIEFLPGEKYAAKNAHISENLDFFEDAGYILKDDDLILDIDNLDHEQITDLIRTFNIQTQIVWTERGAHFYYKKPDGFRGARSVCALGFELEYKHIKNTKTITVKRAGVVREVQNSGIREALPEFFVPRRKVVSLLGLDEGEGRNQAIFKHRGHIAGVKNWEKILEFINQVILANPLPENEMHALTREMDMEPAQDAEGIIADLIMFEKKVVKYSGALYYYENGEYITDPDKFIRMVYNYCPGKKTAYVKEVIDQINARTKLIPDDKTFDIKLKNGILRDGQFIEVNYTDFTPYNIPIEYDPEIKPIQEVDDYLNHLTNSDEDYKKHVLEMLGHCLIVDKEVKRMLGKFFILVGSGGNGKGTLLSIIRAILNIKNCSALSIKKITDERYFNILSGKLANLGDDIHDEPINNEQMKILKNISTCDFVEMRKLYKDATSIEMTPTLIYTSNHVLKSFEKGDSYKRRVVWMPMFTKVEKKDKRFISKITSKQALKYWLKLVVDGYFRLYQNEAFTKCEALEKYNQRYHEDNDTTLEFVLDLVPEDIIGKRAPEVYGLYTNWAEENGLNVLSSRALKATIRKIHLLEIKAKKINKKTAKVYNPIPPE